MLDLVQLAGMLPKNPVFREWVGCGDAVPQEFAEEYIRAKCLVVSRRDLATNPEAAQRFHNLIRRPFVEFCEKQEMTV